MEQVYDDMLPVCRFTTKRGERLLLDRHNDLIATFDPSIEEADIERIVHAINRSLE